MSTSLNTDAFLSQSESPARPLHCQTHCWRVRSLFGPPYPTGPSATALSAVSIFMPPVKTKLIVDGGRHAPSLFGEVAGVLVSKPSNKCTSVCYTTLIHKMFVSNKNDNRIYVAQTGFKGAWLHSLYKKKFSSEL